MQLHFGGVDVLYTLWSWFAFAVRNQGSYDVHWQEIPESDLLEFEK
ncbi:hypothetical protein CLOSTMETH_00588 [[Clostridium] methylpentosum DSM 5476]|uniref:Uncharacterized protein n=1 Tax=[Clostridium] methylpentosum DSM 5476 TaxID=537013 RepID=C0E9T7_9FIRM|nr:hypothetical protein CLOSTMETH_00588 [[Clostridium] methylpentosum DSM 5476]